jgi:hypothetical protein
VRGSPVGIIEHFETRKRQVEEDITFAETQPGFRIVQKSINGENDVTAVYLERLRAARDAYTEAIEWLKIRAEETSALKPAPGG